MSEWEEQEVLFTVKTYPSPSTSYNETVCTAGITRDGRFIRVYPIPFRYLNEMQQFKKYEWVRVKVRKSDTDHRLESYKVDYDSIKPTGEFVKEWSERLHYLKPFIRKSTNALDNENMTLGLIKPVKIHDLICSEDDGEWSARQQACLSRLTIDNILNERKLLPLEKIPHKFQFRFDDHEENHTIIVKDWELYALYLRYKGRNPTDIVYDKFFNQICSDKNDVYFIMGTMHRFKSWLILGILYPPKGTDAIKKYTIEDF
ncbi:hypothetical protein ADMFC3_23570 [Geovibrio sp. ADMFC3]